MNFRNFLRLLIIHTVLIHAVIQLVTDTIGSLSALALSQFGPHVHALALDELNFGVHFIDFFLG